MKDVEITNLHGRSSAVGRNGKYDIVRLAVRQAGEKNLVKIDCVSRRLHRQLNAGFRIGVSDMDRLAVQWLEMRGLGGEGRPNLTQSGRTVTQCLAEIRGLAEEAEKALE
jgi:hypothetical protein